MSANDVCWRKVVIINFEVLKYEVVFRSTSAIVVIRFLNECINVVVFGSVKTFLAKDKCIDVTIIYFLILNNILTFELFYYMCT